LMRDTWEIADFRSAERGELLFLKDQASRIRAEVRRRMNTAKPVPDRKPQER
jgi:hypothetical protein